MGKNPGYLGPSRQDTVDRVTMVKESSPCLDCGKYFPACCMDFDHAGGIKGAEVGRLVAGGAKWDVIQREIEKCELVCSNCHRIRTRNAGGGGWTRTVEHDDIPKTRGET